MSAHRPHWSPLATRCPRPWRRWLLDRGSLTRRLQAQSEGRLTVQLLTQSWQRPRADEARALGIPHCQLALVREVLLQGHGQNWVYARSVLPRKAALGRMRHLHRLGTRPLGEWLFRHPNIQRGPILLTRWPAAHLPPPLLQSLAVPSPLWARYSLFRYHQDTLLVSEFFLPALPSLPVGQDT